MHIFFFRVVPFSRVETKGERKKYFWPGAISIIEQQYMYDKNNKMIRVPSKDSDQVGHLTSLNATVIFLQLDHGSKGLPRSKLVSPFQQYFSHIGTMEGWT